MVNELNDAVKGVISTEDIPISPKVMDAIDILDELQVPYILWFSEVNFQLMLYKSVVCFIVK